LEENTVTIEPILEDDQQRKGYKSLMPSSGAANTALFEDEHYYFVHGGREAETFEFGGNNTLVVCVGSIGFMKETQLADWITCLWRANKFEHITFPFISEHVAGWQAAVKLRPLKALSCTNVEDPANIDVTETVSFSAGLVSEGEVEALPWRGTYCVPHTEKMLFSQNVEIRTSELPRWKPRVIVDRHTP
jgi:hypothetical protein